MSPAGSENRPQAIVGAVGRHLNVRDRDVGPVHMNLLDEFRRIAGHADDFHPAGREHVDYAVTKDRLIFPHNDPARSSLGHSQIPMSSDSATTGLRRPERRGEPVRETRPAVILARFDTKSIRHPALSCNPHPGEFSAFQSVPVVQTAGVEISLDACILLHLKFQSMAADHAIRYQTGVSGELGKVASLVRQYGDVSRSELARHVGLSRTSLSSRLDELRRLSLIEEVGPGPSSGGRPPALVRFAAKSGTVAGIDLGATSVSVGVTDLNGTPLLVVSREIDVRHGPKQILDVITTELDAILAKDPSWRERLRGVGIGLPGPVEFLTGRPISPPIMPGWDQFPVREFFEERYGRPVFVDNDVNLMAQGEAWSGRGAHVDNMMWVKIGSGIGCGIVVHGHIYRGADGSAGDIGHIALRGADAPCRCGKTGCLESVAGGFALGEAALQLARSGASPTLAQLLTANGTVSASDLAIAVELGDTQVNTLVRSAGRSIGEVMAALVNFFNPDLIVIGGGVSNVGDLLLAAIRETIYRYSLPLATSRLAITHSTLGEDVGVIGAAALVLDELYRLGRIPVER